VQWISTAGGGYLSGRLRAKLAIIESRSRLVRKPSPKPARCARTDAEEPVPGLSSAQLLALSPAQLRARAQRLLEMADEFPGHDMGQLLLKLAAEFSARANALERKH
jgi:hypothetical protein